MICGLYVRGVILATLLVGTILFTLAATLIDPKIHFLGNGLYSLFAVLACYGAAAVVSILVALFIYFVFKCVVPYDDTPTQEAIYETYGR